MIAFQLVINDTLVDEYVPSDQELFKPSPDLTSFEDKIRQKKEIDACVVFIKTHRLDDIIRHGNYEVYVVYRNIL
jgi:hypothetical protein